MKTLYLLAIICFCAVSAKYIPHESSISSRTLLWEEQLVSDSNESDHSKEDSSDSNDSLENKIKEEQQKKLEKIEKDKRKLEEKLQKEQEKLKKEQEKIQKEQEKRERKQKEQIQKQIKKMEEEAHKREEKFNKKISSAQNDDDLEDIIKHHVYQKYGLTPFSTKLEKKNALDQYFQDKLGLPANSSKDEKRKAVIQLVGSNSQNDITTRDELRNVVLNNAGETGVLSFRTEIEEDIQDLDAKIAVLSQIPSPWAKLVSDQLEQKRSFLTAVYQLIAPTRVQPEQKVDSPNALNTKPNSVSLGNTVEDLNVQNKIISSENSDQVTSPKTSVASPSSVSTYKVQSDATSNNNGNQAVSFTEAHLPSSTSNTGNINSVPGSFQVVDGNFPSSSLDTSASIPNFVFNRPSKTDVSNDDKLLTRLSGNEPHPTNTGPHSTNTGPHPISNGLHPANTGPHSTNTGPQPTKPESHLINNGPRLTNTGPLPTSNGQVENEVYSYGQNSAISGSSTLTSSDIVIQSKNPSIENIPAISNGINKESILPNVENIPTGDVSFTNGLNNKNNVSPLGSEKPENTIATNTESIVQEISTAGNTDQNDLTILEKIAAWLSGSKPVPVETINVTNDVITNTANSAPTISDGTSTAGTNAVSNHILASNTISQSDSDVSGVSGKSSSADQAPETNPLENVVLNDGATITSEKIAQSSVSDTVTINKGSSSIPLDTASGTTSIVTDLKNGPTTDVSASIPNALDSVALNIEKTFGDPGVSSVATDSRSVTADTSVQPLIDTTGTSGDISATSVSDIAVKATNIVNSATIDTQTSKSLGTTVVDIVSGTTPTIISDVSVQSILPEVGIANTIDSVASDIQNSNIASETLVTGTTPGVASPINNVANDVTAVIGDTSVQSSVDTIPISDTEGAVDVTNNIDSFITGSHPSSVPVDTISENTATGTTLVVIEQGSDSTKVPIQPTTEAKTSNIATDASVLDITSGTFLTPNVVINDAAVVTNAASAQPSIDNTAALVNDITASDSIVDTATPVASNNQELINVAGTVSQATEIAAKPSVPTDSNVSSTIKEPQNAPVIENQPDVSTVSASASTIDQGITSTPPEPTPAEISVTAPEEIIVPSAPGVTIIDVNAVNSEIAVDAATPVVDSATPAVDPAIPAVDSTTSVVNSATTIEDSATPVVDAASSVVDAATPVVDSATSVVDAATPVVDSAIPVVDPAISVVDSATSGVNAATPVDDSVTSVVDYSVPVVDSATAVVDAATPVVDSVTSVVNAAIPEVDSAILVVDPAISVVDSATSGVNAATPVDNFATPVVDSSVPVVDSATAVVDAATPVIDSATSVVDAATPVVDSAIPVVDPAISVVDSANSGVNAATPVDNSATPVVDSSVPVVDSATAVVDVATSVIGSATSVVDAATPVIDSAISVVDSATPVVDSTIPVVDAVTQVVDSSVIVVDSATPVVDAATPVVDSAIPVVNAASPVVDDVTPVVDSASLVVDVATPVVDSATLVVDAATPVVDSAIPVVNAASPVVDDVTPVVDSASLVVDVATPVVDSATLVVDAATPVVDSAIPVVNAASPVVDDVTPVVDSASLVVDVATPVVDAATPVVDSATSVVKAASPVEDSATPVVNSATSVGDAAIPVVESATPVVDASVSVVDSATPVLDSTTAVEDAAISVIDAAIPVVDSFTPVVESATPVVDSDISVVDSTAPVVDATNQESTTVVGMEAQTTDITTKPSVPTDSNVSSTTTEPQNGLVIKNQPDVSTADATILGQVIISAAPETILADASVATPEEIILPSEPGVTIVDIATVTSEAPIQASIDTTVALVNDVTAPESIADAYTPVVDSVKQESINVAGTESQATDVTAKPFIVIPKPQNAAIIGSQPDITTADATTLDKVITRAALETVPAEVEVTKPEKIFVPSEAGATVIDVTTQ